MSRCIKHAQSPIESAQQLTPNRRSADIELDVGRTIPVRLVEVETIRDPSPGDCWYRYPFAWHHGSLSVTSTRRWSFRTPFSWGCSRSRCWLKSSQWGWWATRDVTCERVGTGGWNEWMPAVFAGLKVAEIFVEAVSVQEIQRLFWATNDNDLNPGMLTWHDAPSTSNVEDCTSPRCRWNIKARTPVAFVVPPKNPVPHLKTGQVRHGGGLLWACSSGHPNDTTDSWSTARIHSRDHQRVDPPDYVLRALRGAGAAGTNLCVKCRDLCWSPAPICLLFLCCYASNGLQHAGIACM